MNSAHMVASVLPKTMSSVVDWSCEGRKPKTTPTIATMAKGCPFTLRRLAKEQIDALDWSKPIGFYYSHRDSFRPPALFFVHILVWLETNRGTPGFLLEDRGWGLGRDLDTFRREAEIFLAVEYNLLSDF